MTEEEIVLTDDEIAWWKSTAVDCKRITGDGNKLYDFVDMALPIFFRTFPNRHPRTFRQSSRSAEEAGEVFGEYEWVRMREVQHTLYAYRV